MRDVEEMDGTELVSVARDFAIWYLACKSGAAGRWAFKTRLANAFPPPTFLSTPHTPKDEPHNARQDQQLFIIHSYPRSPIEMQIPYSPLEIYSQHAQSRKVTTQSPARATVFRAPALWARTHQSPRDASPTVLRSQFSARNVIATALVGLDHRNTSLASAPVSGCSCQACRAWDPLCVSILSVWTSQSHRVNWPRNLTLSHTLVLFQVLRSFKVTQAAFYV